MTINISDEQKIAVAGNREPGTYAVVEGHSSSFVRGIEILKFNVESSFKEAPAASYKSSRVHPTPDGLLNKG